MPLETLAQTQSKTINQKKQKLLPITNEHSCRNQSTLNNVEVKSKKSEKNYETNETRTIAYNKQTQLSKPKHTY